MRTAMRARITRLAVLAAVVLGMGAFSALRAADPAAGAVWLISTRYSPYCCNGGTAADGLHYWRLGSGDQWTGLDLKAFLAADDPAVPTVFFLHGNRADEADAVRDGWCLYQALLGLAPVQTMRFVIWSWPAEQIAGGLRGARYDAQVKAARSDGQACYLAQVLGRMNPKVSVSLVGYSFGARIVTGAAQLLAGGEVAGQAASPANPAAPRTLMRAVLVAAAEDYYWLAPGYQHGLAPGQMDRVLLTINQADPVLRFYPRLYGRGGPGALGYVGAASGTDTTKVEPLNVTCSVGKTHDWDCYLADPWLRGRLAWYAFLQPSESEILKPAAPESATATGASSRP
jgi:hypothetical protein